MRLGGIGVATGGLGLGRGFEAVDRGLDIGQAEAKLSLLVPNLALELNEGDASVVGHAIDRPQGHIQFSRDHGCSYQLLTFHTSQYSTGGVSDVNDVDVVSFPLTPSYDTAKMLSSKDANAITAGDLMSIWNGAKAIETVYAGHKFRSRLEARWGVFFDHLGIPWEYEPEGFEIEGTRYLPDFWLPNQKCWFEVKPDEVLGSEASKAALLAQASGYPVFVFKGQIKATSDYVESDHGEVYEPAGWDNYQTWCYCPQCGTKAIIFEGRSDRLPCKECYFRGVARMGGPLFVDHTCTPLCDGCRRSGHGDRGENGDSPLLLAAYQAAASARFEHGAHG